jgi:hypothetical protein
MISFHGETVAELRAAIEEFLAGIESPPLREG